MGYQEKYKTPLGNHYIGCVTDILLKDFLNMMLPLPWFFTGHRNYLGITLLLFADNIASWTM